MTAGWSRIDKATAGLVVVDHGSAETAANHAFEDLTRSRFDDGTWRHVEPAHMELAEPTIPTAVHACVDTDVSAVVVSPFFLLPGRHWQTDIPAAVRSALTGTGVPFLVTAPIGLDPTIAVAVGASVEACLAQAAGSGSVCPSCLLLGMRGCRVTATDA
ncbi:MAG: hypothetical protein IT198_07730 [Acidimicrobiia bacterium]|nr:hypothetical protein [Acidimicrobiia bacterium]